MKVEVICPGTNLGDVMGDLNSRRAHIESAEPQFGELYIIRAKVPLAEMFGYATTVRSLTQGRATHSMEPSHYAEMPAGLAEEVIGGTVARGARAHAR